MNEVWKDHSKHVFVLTSAGKPVFSRYGNEMEQTAITSVITAIVGRTLDTADPIKVITAGHTTLVFSLRGPFVLVAVARTGETVHCLQEQLRAIHSAILMTLTDRIEKRLSERPGLDVRQSLGGTRTQFLNLVRGANRYPTAWLDAVPVLTLPAGVKSRIASTLATASQRCGGVVYAILVAGMAVVAWAQTRTKEYALRPHDLLLLTNLVQSSKGLRVSDSWSPVCLPTLNSSGFLHVYSSYLGAANVAMPGAPAAGSSKPGGGGGGHGSHATEGAASLARFGGAVPEPRAGVPSAPAAYAGAGGHASSASAPADLPTSSDASLSPRERTAEAAVSHGAGAPSAGTGAPVAASSAAGRSTAFTAAPAAPRGDVSVRAARATMPPSLRSSAGDTGRSVAGGSRVAWQPSLAATDEGGSAAAAASGAGGGGDAGASSDVYRGSAVPSPTFSDDHADGSATHTSVLHGEEEEEATEHTHSAAGDGGICGGTAARGLCLDGLDQAEDGDAEGAGGQGDRDAELTDSGAADTASRLVLTEASESINPRRPASTHALRAADGALLSGPGTPGSEASSAAGGTLGLGPHSGSQRQASTGADSAFGSSTGEPGGEEAAAEAERASDALCASPASSLASDTPGGDETAGADDARSSPKAQARGSAAGSRLVGLAQSPRLRSSSTGALPSDLPRLPAAAAAEADALRAEGGLLVDSAASGGGSRPAPIVPRHGGSISGPSGAGGMGSPLRRGGSASAGQLDTLVSAAAAARGGAQGTEGAGLHAAPSAETLSAGHLSGEEAGGEGDELRSDAAAAAAAEEGSILSGASADVGVGLSLDAAAAAGAGEASRLESMVSPAAHATAPLSAAAGRTPHAAEPEAGSPTKSALAAAAAASAAVSMAGIHIGHEPPAVFLLLVSSETAASHVEALTARKAALVQQLHESQGLSHVLRALAAAHTGHGGGVGDFLAAAYGIPGLLHFVYVWKPWRQYTMSKFPPALAEHAQRKALLRAYQVCYDRLTATVPPLRHCVSSFGGWEGSIAHVAGIHTTNALVLCAFDGSVATDRVTVATEKLAKAVKRDHDKVLLPAPGTLN